MSLAKAAQSLPERVLAAAMGRELKTLVVDVERLPGRFTWTDRYDGLTISGEFWSLSDYKRKFGRIPAEMVTEWPRTITAAWRWYGEKKIHFAAEWENGPAAFAEQMRDVLDEADIATGHWITGADRKWLNSLFRDHGLRFPSPYKLVDTLLVARRHLGDESMKLSALCDRYGIPTKVGAYDRHIARAACEGDAKAQRNIKAYNMADVEASTGLYAVLLPLTTAHPHVAPAAAEDATTCPRCSSKDVARHGTYSPAVYVYSRYLCNTCEGWFRTNYQGRGPSVKAIA